MNRRFVIIAFTLLSIAGIACNAEGEKSKKVKPTLFIGGGEGQGDRAAGVASCSEETGSGRFRGRADLRGAGDPAQGDGAALLRQL